MRLLSLLLLLLSLGACRHFSIRPSYETCYERFGHLEMRDSVWVDTVKVEVPGARLDTLVMLSKRDTFYFTKEHFNVRIERVNDSFEVSGGCDTLWISEPYEVKVPVHHHHWKERELRAGAGLWRKWWFWAVLCVCLFLVLLRRV